MNNNIKKNKGHTCRQAGFTLIEIMVATSIFMIIMLVALGALISSSDTAKKSQALRQAMDNVNFAMESMTRSLRMGSDYSCINSSLFSLPALSGVDCPFGSSGGTAIAFTQADYDISKQRRNSAYVLVPRNDALGTSVLRRCIPDEFDQAICSDLVSKDVNIENLTFFVKGSDPTDKIQPSVYILIKGSVMVKGVANPFAIQTMAAQRSAE